MEPLKLALQLAQDAGNLMRTNFNLGMKREWKSDNTPVTETDLAINQNVIDSVKAHFPTHSILAEEGSDFSEDSEFVWVCDPVDGTLPFCHGIPTAVFSLALVQNGEPILGVVYDPFLDRLYHAEKGKGAFLNDQKITVSKQARLQNSVLAVDHWKDAPYDFSALAMAVQNEGGKLIDVGSITYMGALVAHGEFVATIFPGQKPHDTAALKILIEEAGGKVTNIFGNEQRYDRDIKGHVASNGKLHNELLQLIQKTVVL